MFQDNLHSGKPEDIENSEALLKEVISGQLQEFIFLAKDNLGSIIHNTEKEFLSIGQNLQTYHKSAKNITGIAGNINEIISDKILKSGINELSKLLLKINDYLNSSAEDIKGGESSLYNIMSVLDSVVDNLSGFKRIVKHLRMLGISTRIESARLSHDDAGFTALAENVEKLSSIINERASNIKVKATQLTAIINETISRIITLESKQNEQTTRILGTISLNMSALNDKYNHCSQKAGLISEKSAVISQNISRIVSSIQFHDITRQQMEHVTEAFDLLDQKTRGNIADEEDLRKKAAFTYNICTLQSMQLKNTKNEFCTAVEAIIESLNNVRYNVSDLMDEAGNMLSDSTDSEKVNVIKEIESGFSGIATSLSKSSEIRIELTDSMKSVTDTISHLASYIDEIEEIGSEIELIALNSSIKAAHTGAEGAALGILADSIQRLSNESKSNTKSVSETLKQISDISDVLYSSLEYNAGNKNFHQYKEITTEISTQIEALSVFDSDSFKQLSELNSSFEKLDNQILLTVNSIDVHQKISGVIESLTTSLDEITGRINLLAGSEVLNNPEELSELNIQYTMNSERNIHNSFMKAEGNPIQSEPNSEEGVDLFGDNVELF